jgi:hypothetical protein
MKDHWFWWMLTLAVLIWYSTVTVWVAVRGTRDIRGMLHRLAQRPAEKAAENGSEKPLPPR